MWELFDVQLCTLLFALTGVISKNPKSHSTGAIEKLKVKTTDDNPGEISLQKQFFQDIFMEQEREDKLQFGYVCENPTEWEQRFEEKDLGENRHRGKVKWGNVDGSYGEHYWDLNHK